MTKNDNKIFQIGMLDRDEVDIGLLDIFATVSRSKAVNYSPILQNLE